MTKTTEKRNTIVDESSLPVMMYLHGFMSGANGAKQRQLQKMFKGRYHVIAPELDADIESSLQIINTLVDVMEPEIIIGTSLGGFMAMMCEHGDADVVVVNPVTNPRKQLARWLNEEQTYFCPRLDGVQTYTLTNKTLDKYSHYKFNETARTWGRRYLSALCSTADDLLGDSHIKMMRTMVNPDYMMVVDDFGHQCRDAGMTHLKDLLEKVIARREYIRQSAMSYEEFDEMARNRPVPDTPGYYHLDVLALMPGDEWNENITHRLTPFEGDVKFDCYINHGSVSFRAPANCVTTGYGPLSADYATREEAEAAMREMAGQGNLLGFVISRNGFGQLANHRFHLGQWMYGARGQFIQAAHCSSYHYRMPGLYGKYFGRNHDKLPYQLGDKVVCLRSYPGDSRKYAVLGVIVGMPKSRKWGYDYYKSHLDKWVRDGNSPETWADATDYEGIDGDEYFVQFGPYNTDMTEFAFLNPMEIFPVPVQLPTEIDREIDEWYRQFQKAEGNPEYQGENQIRMANGFIIGCEVDDTVTQTIRNPYCENGFNGVVHEQCRGAWWHEFYKIIPMLPEHGEEVFFDGAKFLCPVPITKQMEGAGYKKGLSAQVTLGQYMEWWTTEPKALDTNGNRILTFTDSEDCTSIDPEGNRVPGHLAYPADEVWQSFLSLNARYAIPYNRFKHCSVQDLINQYGRS